jgi:hypothetical protein
MKKVILMITFLAWISVVAACAQNAKTQQSLILNYSLPPTGEVIVSSRMAGFLTENKKLGGICTEDTMLGEDLFVFKQNDLYGFMDINGGIKIRPQFEKVSDFSGGLANVSIRIEGDSRYSDTGQHEIAGYIDTAGNLAMPYFFLSAGDFCDDYASVIDQNYEQYYVNIKGEKQFVNVKKEYENGRSFYYGYAAVLISGGSPFPIPNPLPEIWSYIDKTGRIATDKEFEYAGDFGKEYAIVKYDGKYAIIDTDFNTILDYKCDDMRETDSELFAVQKDGKWGLIDISGNVRVDFLYEYIGYFSEGLAPVNKERFLGALSDAAYIDVNGNVVLDSKFKLTFMFIDGFACVVDKGTGKYGVIDRSGKYVIEPKYSYLGQRKGGLFEAKNEDSGQENFYIDLQGERIVPTVPPGNKPAPLPGLSSWARNEADFLNLRGVVPLTIKIDFQQFIRRDEFTALMLNVYELVTGSVTTYASHFTDFEGSAYKTAIEKAKTVGLIDGTSANTFTPNGLLTREQAAKILCNVVSQIEGINPQPSGPPDYVDSAAISEWALSYVAYAQENKIMQGSSSGRFNPQSNLTREEAMLVAERLIVQYGW